MTLCSGVEADFVPGTEISALPFVCQLVLGWCKSNSGFGL